MHANDHPGVKWSVCHPTETTTATQGRIGLYGDEVIGLYWHLSNGFQRTAGRKVYSSELEIQKAITRSAIKQSFGKLLLLKAELARLNK